MGNFLSSASSSDVGGEEEVVVGHDESGLLFQVLEYCDYATRSRCVFLSRGYHRALTSDAAFRWHLNCMHIECGIFSPRQLLDSPSSGGETWKSIFMNLSKRRNLWLVSPTSKRKTTKTTNRDESEEKFHITVCARFKPLNLKTQQYHEPKFRSTLPFHQRLSLIKLSHGIKSNSEALKILRQEGGWFKEKWEEEEKVELGSMMDDDDDDEATRKNNNSVSCGISAIDSQAGRVMVVDPTKGIREFEFDHVHTDETEQAKVYTSSVSRLVCDFINGYTATCLVYGMTGSGKTHTMFGPTLDDTFWSSAESGYMQGIVPRACSDIFDILQYRKDNLNLTMEAKLSVSYIEIFGNDINDLLKGGNLCGQNRASAHRYVLSGAADEPVRNNADVIHILQKGETQKRKAATAMNERSSRAHSIFILSLSQKCLDSGITVNSKLFLTDLGGNEQTKKSQVATSDKEIQAELTRVRNSVGYVKNDRMREAVNINLGLMALKSCVDALKSGNKAAYVPYADSKLTMMLSSGLGGNSKTAVIICANQEEEHLSETIAALKFGQSCRSITTTARTDTTGMLDNLIHKLDEKIKECEENIMKNERWEIREERRTIDMFSEVELKKTTVLVGAEEDRMRLSDLLRRKAELTGTAFDNNSGGTRKNEKFAFGDGHTYGMDLTS
eukprot:scaffold22023_cov47-Attheya_sp.AAC.1